MKAHRPSSPSCKSTQASFAIRACLMDLVDSSGKISGSTDELRQVACRLLLQVGRDRGPLATVHYRVLAHLASLARIVMVYSMGYANDNRLDSCLAPILNGLFVAAHERPEDFPLPEDYDCVERDNVIVITQAVKSIESCVT